jgi:hypothetical protein
MSTRSLQQLIELFDKKTVVVLKEMQEALSAASRATVFRYLAQVGYRRSYNRNGRYYMRHDPSRYDKHGVFSYKGIHFSRHGNLSTTVSVFICESDTGCTQRELQELLRVRVQSVLLSMMRTGKVTREKIEGHFLYLHPDAKPRTAQIEKRRKMLAEHAFAGEVSDSVAIQVLLTLIRHPGSRAGDVARRLKGYSPPITLRHVQVVFDRYNLDDVGEKGGPSSC